MRVALCFFAIFITTSINIALLGTANAEEDVLGWRDIKWGMRQAEVRKLYPTIKCKSTPNNLVVCNPQRDINIANNDYKLAFTFDGGEKDSKVIKVLLLSLGEPGEFNDIYGLISGKYGKHSSYKKNIMGDPEYLWFRKSGQIKLTISNSIGVCSIEYIKASDETDKL